LLQFPATKRTIIEFCRHIGLAIWAVFIEGQKVVNTSQVFIHDFSAGIYLKFPANKRIQLINAAAARGIYIIPGIPPENRYKKYVKIPVCLMNFIPGQTSARGTYDTAGKSQVFIFILDAKKRNKEHLITLSLAGVYVLWLYIWFLYIWFLKILYSHIIYFEIYIHSYILNII